MRYSSVILGYAGDLNKYDPEHELSSVTKEDIKGTFEYVYNTMASNFSLEDTNISSLEDKVQDIDLIKSRMTDDNIRINKLYGFLGLEIDAYGKARTQQKGASNTMSNNNTSYTASSTPGSISITNANSLEISSSSYSSYSLEDYIKKAITESLTEIRNSIENNCHHFKKEMIAEYPDLKDVLIPCSVYQSDYDICMAFLNDTYVKNDTEVISNRQYINFQQSNSVNPAKEYSFNIFIYAVKDPNSGAYNYSYGTFPLNDLEADIAGAIMEENGMDKQSSDSFKLKSVLNN
jgi:hypothetical protein